MNRFAGKFLDLPEGWKRRSGYALEGWCRCCNGKSLFADDFQWGYVFDQEWWEDNMYFAQKEYEDRLWRAERATTDEQKEYWLNRANILRIVGGINESTCI